MKRSAGVRRYLHDILHPMGVVVATCLFAGAAWSDEASVLGVWSGGDSLVEVTITGEGLSMKVLAIRDVVYLPDEGLGEPGSPRKDDNNPDALRPDGPRRRWRVGGRLRRHSKSGGRQETARGRTGKLKPVHGTERKGKPGIHGPALWHAQTGMETKSR